MANVSTIDIMRAYLDALAKSDFVRARSYLVDQNFLYIGPLSRFNDADAFIADISRVGAIMEKIECRRIFVDDMELCVITNVKTSMSGLRSTPVVLWVKIVGERIATMETFYDARDYAAMFKTD